MKTLTQLFSKYVPGPEVKAFFDEATEYCVKKSNKRNNAYEIEVSLTRIVSRRVLYEAEDKIRESI